MCHESSYVLLFFFKQKTAYEMRISDWSSDVCSSDLAHRKITRAKQAYVAHPIDARQLIPHLRQRVIGNIGTIERPVGRNQIGDEQKVGGGLARDHPQDRKSTRLNYSH